MLKPPWTAFAVALLAAPTLLAQTSGAPTAEVPSLTVHGSAEVLAEPDQAVVRLGVLTQKPTADAAQAAANEIARSILAALATTGVSDDAVQTSELSLSPVYASHESRSPNPQEPRIVAYRASNQVSVRLTDLDLLGPAVDAALGAGANRLDGIDFQLQDEEPVRRQALRRAVAAARGKAAAIAEALDVSLGEILEAIESGVTLHQPRFAQARVMAAEAAADSMPIAAGQLVVSADVTLRYRLTP